MDSEGNLSGNSSGELPKILKDQTNVSTGIGPTGTDTPAPKDLMLHCDQMVRLISDPPLILGLCKLHVDSYCCTIMSLGCLI